MTCEETINVLKEDNTFITFESYEESSDEIKEMAIEALEKQIPKKPLPAKRPMSKVNVRCPECGRTFYAVEVVGALNYCPDCGQRIDWSDEE